MRPINVPLEDLAKTVLSIGFLGENMHTQVLFDCKKLYEEYPSAVPALTVKPPEGDPYPAITSVDDGIVTWGIRDTDLTHEGNGEIQLTFTVDEVVAKSYIGKTRVGRSIMPTGDIPDPIDNWITEANTVLNTIPQTIEDGINNKMGEITAEAETLTPGSEATASFDPETKVIAFGIPEGQKGETGESGLVARFYPDLVVFPCNSERKFLVHTTCTTKFEVLRGSERINATFLEDHTTTETTLEYYGMDWWVTEQCTPEHPGTLKINVYKDVDPFTPAWKRDALIAPCTFHLENGESIQTALPLVCTREGKDGYDGSDAIDDTAGTGDTDKVWSADKVSGELDGKADKTDTVLNTTLSMHRNSNPGVGQNSVAIGNFVSASGNNSMATGYHTKASGRNTFASGDNTTASGDYSFSEGTVTVASGEGSHAEGGMTQASGHYSHSENRGTVSSGNNSHSEGFKTTASGIDSHADGCHTVANHMAQHAFGVANVEDPSTAPSTEKGNYIEIVGNGLFDHMDTEMRVTRRNARALDWDGNERLRGDLYVHCNTDSTGGKKVLYEPRGIRIPGWTIKVNNSQELEFTEMPDPTSVIYDNAGQYATNKTWSASKLIREFAGKMDDVGIATEVETRVIISEYDNSGALIAEMEFYTDSEYNAGFKTISDADEIAEAVTSGKRVLLHIPNVSDAPSYYHVNDEAYLEVVGYMPEYTYETGYGGETRTSPANFIVANAGNNINNNYSSETGLMYISGTKIDSNGKLCLVIYVG